ncbi:MAG: cupin domain-containing protein [Clostridia bacterium]|nr:cupin domain-containing protein [Clostridia bacterium]
MKLNFDQIETTCLPRFNGGEGKLLANLFTDARVKILRGRLEPGASIGFHCHATSCEVVYILDGSGKMITEEGEERLTAGECHYCPLGASHSLCNDSGADLLFFAVVPQQV